MRRLLIVLALPVLLSGAPSIASAAPAAVTLQDYFTPQEIARADAYRTPRYLYSFSALGLSLLALAAMGLGPGSRALARWSRRLTKGRWIRRAALLAVIVTLVPWALTLPFTVLRFRLDRRYGLATGTVGGTVADSAKGVGFQLVIAVVGAVVFIAIARRLPRAWPVVIGLVAAAATVAAVFVFPVIYEPAFNRFTPADPATTARVERIADSVSLPVDEVLIADASRRTTAENAYVSGFGATRRVVLYDTLVHDAPPRQLDVVVAHEFGHVLHHDVIWGTVQGAAGAFLGALVLGSLLRRPRWLTWMGERLMRMMVRRRPLVERLGARDAGDPAVIPFIALFLAVASVLTLPLVNGLSRRVEASADRTAIQITGDPQAAINLEVRLARENIDDLTPNGFIRWMFFSHPTALERIEAARAMEGAGP